MIFERYHSILSRFTRPPQSIFDRWGRRVYETEQYKNSWGAEAEAGLYYYVLRQPASNQVLKGWVEVLR